MKLYVRLIILIVAINTTSTIHVQPEWKIYYDIKTNQSIDTIDVSNPRVQLYRQLMKQLRIGFGPIPCSCQSLTCGCCAGMNIQLFDFNRRACMNFTYDPQEFAMNMNMFMNDESILSQSISGKNPPPLCAPLPLPPIVPRVDFCLKFFNIHTPGYNLFMCMDFETRMERAPLLVLHFDCMELGQDGISYHKPDEANYPVPEENGPVEGQDDEQIEVYDEVVEDRNLTDTINVTTSQPSKSVIKVENNQNRADSEIQEEIYHDLLENKETHKKEMEGSNETIATTETTTIPI